ncbi:MAG: hypothetical protein AAF391_07305 [Bacteroidota bacterium]
MIFRLSLLGFISFISLSLYAQNIQSFPGCDYSQVEVHRLNAREGHSYARSALVCQTGDFKVLSGPEVNAFVALIQDSASYGDIMAACHQPMIGLVFYQEDKVCAYLSLCLSCNNVYCEPALNLNLDYEKSGFSNHTRKLIRKILSEWNYLFCRL